MRYCPLARMRDASRPIHWPSRPIMSNRLIGREELTRYCFASRLWVQDLIISFKLASSKHKSPHSMLTDLCYCVSRICPFLAWVQNKLEEFFFFSVFFLCHMGAVVPGLRDFVAPFQGAGQRAMWWLPYRDSSCYGYGHRVWLVAGSWWN